MKASLKGGRGEILPGSCKEQMGGKKKNTERHIRALRWGKNWEGGGEGESGGCEKTGGERSDYKRKEKRARGGRGNPGKTALVAKRVGQEKENANPEKINWFGGWGKNERLKMRVRSRERGTGGKSLGHKDSNVSRP